MNISSVVIRTSPQHVEEVVERLRRSGLCDVYFQDDKGRIVVTIEEVNTSNEIKTVKAIQSLPNVLSAELCYAYSEDLGEALKSLGVSDTSVPDQLSDDRMDAGRVRYGGDVKI